MEELLDQVKIWLAFLASVIAYFRGIFQLFPQDLLAEVV